MAEDEDEPMPERSGDQDPGPAQTPAQPPRQAQGPSSTTTSSATDVFRIRPNTALGAAVPTFVQPEASVPGQRTEQRAAGKAGRPKARPAARFPRVQHDDPLLTLQDGTLSV